MSFVAQAAAAVGAVMVALRKAHSPKVQAMGSAPQIPAAKAQSIMTLKMPTAKGWAAGQKPQVAPGLAVNLYAADLRHPRWVEVLENGDVLVAESLQPKSKPRDLLDWAAQATMKRAKAVGKSANRITRLRDTNKNGTAESREFFLTDLNQPIGMAVLGNKFYVGNTDGVVVFPFDGQSVTGEGRQILTFKTGGHWTRSLKLSQDGRKLYVGVGSLSNIGDQGMEAEEGRACIWEIDTQTEDARIFAGGLRNPVGLAWDGQGGKLWTVVNERDGLGDETPPDYLTSVQDGGFYGWPYCYWGQVIDDRVPQDAAKIASALRPDYALGGHTASLGLCWLPAGTLPGLPEGMVIGQHGSWNRSILSGYRVIFVPFEGGQPSGAPVDLLWGFLSEDESTSYGRPVGVAVGPDGKSVLVVDDVGDCLWRLSAAA